MCSYFKVQLSISVWYILILSSLTKILGKSQSLGFLTHFSFFLSPPLPPSPTVQGHTEQRGKRILKKEGLAQETERGQWKSTHLGSGRHRERMVGDEVSNKLGNGSHALRSQYLRHWRLKNNWQAHLQKQSSFPCSKWDKVPGLCQLSARTGEMRAG